MDTLAFEVYRSRGEQLTNAMQLCAEDMESYTSAVALLAVHSAISYNDALLILLTGERPKSESHQAAAKFVRTACGKSKLDSAGVAHLEKLLSAKTDVSYGSRKIRRDQALALFFAAQRFQAWAIQSIAQETKRRDQ